MEPKWTNSKTLRLKKVPGTESLRRQTHLIPVSHPLAKFQTVYFTPSNSLRRRLLTDCNAARSTKNVVRLLVGCVLNWFIIGEKYLPKRYSSCPILVSPSFPRRDTRQEARELKVDVRTGSSGQRARGQF